MSRSFRLLTNAFVQFVCLHDSHYCTNFLISFLFKTYLIHPPATCDSLPIHPYPQLLPHLINWSSPFPRTMSATHLMVDQVAALTAGTFGLAFGGAAILLMRGNNLRPCEICGGMGSWNCVICDGKGVTFKGRTKTKCKACVGRGKRLCKKCDASGWQKKSNFIG